ncbi:MAG: hypothetical protein ACR2IE_09820 [Candidatus Sumerlaeaceae bacterium]
MNTPRKTKLRLGCCEQPAPCGNVAAGSGMAAEVEEILFSVACDGKNGELEETLTSPPDAEIEQDLNKNR